MSENPTESPTVTAANSTEGSNPSLTALAIRPGSNKTQTRGKVWRFCKSCGQGYETWVSQIRWRGSSYCSRKCWLAAPSKILRKIICRHCGKETARQIDTRQLVGRGKFCNRACYNAWNRERRTVSAVCAKCGKAFTRAVAIARQAKRQLFCSRECSVAYHIGRNHHAFRPGSVVRGRRWKEISKRVIERDGRKCVRCGTIDCNLPLHQHLHADHIIPARLFTGRGRRLMNLLSNLATLCMSCHGRKTTHYEPRILKGDMLAIEEFYGKQAKLDALALMARLGKKRV